MILLLNSAGGSMAGFVAGTDRGQSMLLPECLDDWVDESNPIRVIDAFVDALNLRKLGFEGMDPAEVGRPAYHPSVHLKLYIHGYQNLFQLGLPGHVGGRSQPRFRRFHTTKTQRRPSAQ